MKLTSRARRERRQLRRWIRCHGTTGALERANPCLISMRVQVAPLAPWHEWRSLIKWPADAPK